MEYLNQAWTEIVSIWNWLGSGANTIAAIASAIAAIAAWLATRAQLVALRESVRPDLVFDGWKRSQHPLLGDVVSFSRIKNVGKGSANTVLMNAFGQADDDRMIYVMGTLHIPSLAAGVAHDVGRDIIIQWEHVPKARGRHKQVAVTIRAVFCDAVGIQHRVNTNLIIVKDPTPASVPDPIAPGVMLAARDVQHFARRRIKISERLGRLPLLGRFVENEIFPRPRLPK